MNVIGLVLIVLFTAFSVTLIMLINRCKHRRGYYLKDGSVRCIQCHKVLRKGV